MDAVSRGHAGNESTIIKGLIVVSLNGRQSAAELHKLATEVEGHVREMHAHSQKALLYIDVRELNASDISTDARFATRQMHKSLPADATAVIGKSRAAASVMYLLRAVHPGKKIRFFTNARKARNWLEEAHHPKQRLRVGLIAGLLLIALGASVLLGWQTDNVYLMRWIPSLRPMNPLSAVGIMIGGAGLVCYWARKLDRLRWLGVANLTLGLAALLPLHIDYLLYGGRLTAMHEHVAIADSAAICFMAMGIVALIAGRTERWVRPLEYAAGSAVGGLAVLNIFGQLYAHDFVYEQGNFVMAFNLAVAFAIATTTFLLLVIYRQMGSNILRQMSSTGWFIVAALVVVQGATYGVWQQAIDRNDNEARQALAARSEDVRTLVANRMQGYTNAVKGLSGLFKASDYVSERDFAQYYGALDLEENYPGLRSLVFVSAVDDKDVNTFVAKMRQNGVKSDSRPFSVTPKVSASKHFILTYATGSSSTAIGFDVSSVPGRQALYSKVLAGSGIYGSGTVTVPAVGGAKAYKGFFITTPVETSTSTQPIGVVSVVLKYDVFFANLFDQGNTLQDTTVRITDASHKTIYEANHLREPAHYTNTQAVPIANQNWQVSVGVSKQFGVGSAQVHLPMLTLAVGQAFSLFLLLLFLIQSRGRKQALELADTMTKDLQVERNRAVTNDQKSLAILESIGDGVFAIDTKKRLTLLNPVAEAIAGVRAEEVIGKPYDQVLHFEYAKTGTMNDRFIRLALEGRLASMSNHTVIVRGDGKRIAVADSSAPIHDSRGKILGAIVVFRDISKEYELDKAKTEFVSLASHQLRTPLSAINWYGEMLLNGDAGNLNKDQREYITEIFEGSQRMVELVNSLLDVSRLEVGKLTDQPAPTDVRELVHSLEKELHTSIQARQLTLATHIESLPNVIADPKQLRMVVQNLMSNAVKYTAPQGTVDVILRPATPRDMADAGLRSADPHWFFAVQDNGYGIPKEQQPKIFGKLFRADNVRKLDVEGTGLGLYIVKEVVEKMGGRVWFDSTESVGTTFFVVLPVQPGQRKRRV